MELTFASHVENNKVCFIGKAFDIIRQQKLPDVKITEDDVINTIVKWRAVNVYNGECFSLVLVVESVEVMFKQDVSFNFIDGDFISVGASIQNIADAEYEDTINFKPMYVDLYKQTIHGNLICEVTFNG
tara:strand:+ start:153 stop:539 length:387 start_codon:yes stop_codon:yes gene_type:complete